MEFSPTSKGKNITIRTYRLIIKISIKNNNYDNWSNIKSNSIEKSIEQIEEPRKFEITIIDDNGETETHSTLLDENFTLKKAFGCE